jgi:hypothetical protein
VDQVVAAVESVDGPQPPELTSIPRLGGIWDPAPAIMRPWPTADTIGNVPASDVSLTSW